MKGTVKTVNILMIEGARKLIRTCADVKPHEKVLIVTDPERRRVADALAVAAHEAGTRPVVISMMPNKLDGEEPHELARSAMLEADVIFAPVTRSISHSQAVKNALGAGARFLSLAKFDDRQLFVGGINADFDKEKPRCDAIAELFGQASRLHLTSPGGTNLTADISGRPGNSHPCIARNPGEFTAIVNIEANIAPVEGTAEGVIVVDGSVSNFDIGPVRTPITLTVRKGSITSIEGGSEAKLIEKILEELGSAEAYNIAQIAVGLNPECTDFNGWFLNEHGVYGSAHIGIGTSENLGGDLRAPLHFDVMMRSPRLTVDDTLIVSDHVVHIDYP
jgi:leucyl aminopeptidase (aminopeptidase T)